MKYFEQLDIKATLMVWWKYNACPFVNNNLMPDAEYIVFARKGTKINDIPVAEKSRVIRIAMQPQNRIHPTQKPEELIKRLLKLTTKQNDLVLDCFSGSGTTAIACSEMKRNFICVEKNEKYYKASAERLENYNRQLKLF